MSVRIEPKNINSDQTSVLIISQVTGLIFHFSSLLIKTMDKLKSLLKEFETVEVIERRFDTSDGIVTLGENPFVRLP